MICHWPACSRAALSIGTTCPHWAHECHDAARNGTIEFSQEWPDNHTGPDGLEDPNGESLSESQCIDCKCSPATQTLEGNGYCNFCAASPY